MLFFLFSVVNFLLLQASNPVGITFFLQILGSYNIYGILEHLGHDEMFCFCLKLHCYH